LITVGVLSGNRNFENRINTIAKANYLVSPALVVVYAITGRIDFDFINEPIGYRSNGQAVYLKDIWPTRKELQELELNVIIPEIYSKIEQNIRV
jgi:aconitate hydratase